MYSEHFFFAKLFFNLQVSENAKCLQSSRKPACTHIGVFSVSDSLGLCSGCAWAAAIHSFNSFQSEETSRVKKKIIVYY